MNVAVRKVDEGARPEADAIYLSPVTQAADGFPRRAFSIDDVRKMVGAGIIDEDEKWELVDGDIVPMQAKSHPREIVKSAPASGSPSPCRTTFGWVSKARCISPTERCLGLTSSSTAKD